LRQDALDAAPANVLYDAASDGLLSQLLNGSSTNTSIVGYGLASQGDHLKARDRVKFGLMTRAGSILQALKAVTMKPGTPTLNRAGMNPAPLGNLGYGSTLLASEDDASAQGLSLRTGGSADPPLQLGALLGIELQAEARTSATPPPAG
jgi:hypothetical protein